MQDKSKPSNSTSHWILPIYNLAWRLAMPILRWNKRLAKGFDQRILKGDCPQAADVWIQAASAGEAQLAKEILARLKPGFPVRVFLTSMTSQGVDILDEIVSNNSLMAPEITAKVAYFPFDRLDIMTRAVDSISPKLMVLLETEIWPNLLLALKKQGCKIIIINGRLNPKSLANYSLLPSLWRLLAPDRILAISEKDAERFRKLFGATSVDCMPNIKFDRLEGSKNDATSLPIAKKIIPEKYPFVVLGSVRREEEAEVLELICCLAQERPDLVIGLFPRHLHRVQHWEKALRKRSIPWALRSKLEQPVEPGTVIVWDVFGELSDGYDMASAVFVGGSLASVGGQNFLEPLTSGLRPVIGPYWGNFAWTGEEIFTQGLVLQVADWRIAANTLLEQLETPRHRQEVKDAALRYLQKRQGGAALACQAICQFLEPPTADNPAIRHP